MQIFDCFPSPYIKAADLQGKDVPVVIDTVTIEDVGHPKERLPVVYFSGHDKGMVLNVTNSGTISSLYGENTAEWKGRPITLFPTTTEFSGRTVPCLRIRPVAPQSPQATVVQPTPVESVPLPQQSDPPPASGGIAF